MAKRLFLLLFSAFIGIIGNPEILMASDSFTINGLDNIVIAETVQIADVSVTTEEQATENVSEGSASSNIGDYVAPPSTPNPAPVVPAYVTPNNNIAVAGRVLEIVDVADTTVDSSNHVNKYGPRFLYGHNTAGVFGELTSLGVGSVFSVTYGGVTTNYSVAKIVIFEKNTANGRLQLNGSGNYMRQVANAKSDGVQYDMSLMTCYGTSYGNGDASHRWVIFANAI